MLYTKCSILENKQIAENYFLMRLFSKEITSNARAGQFVQVKVDEDFSPLLMRPFSFFTIDWVKKTFSILYQIKGKGTKKLASHKKDDKISALGPLGNYFSYPKLIRKPVLIAGGVGIAPLACFADDLLRCKKDVTILLGLKEKSIYNFLKEHFNFLKPGRFLAAIESEIPGPGGTVVDFFENITSKQKYDYAAACGPNAMLKNLQKIFNKNDIPVSCSMEAHMSCGIGVCKGCVIKTVEKTKHVYKRVCTDGPIFNLREIVF